MDEGGMLWFKAVTPKFLGRLLVDRARRNAHPGTKKSKIDAGQWVSLQSNLMQVQVQMFRNTQLSGHCWIWASVDQTSLSLPTTLRKGRLGIKYLHVGKSRSYANTDRQLAHPVPVICQELVVSMPKRVATVLVAKRGVTCY
ncbi:hypothetical protein TNCV_2912721 [Trichonephila clavipes]|nr:hypothetical protein TNCV_2912721 [Trichonephila clavipes]